MMRLDAGPSDPTDVSPATPSPEGSNSLATTPSTSPIAVASPTSTPTATTVNTDAPADFTAWVNTALQSRLGLTKYSLIPASTKKDLINKIWQDPTIQQDYVTNHSTLASGNVASLALIENQIQGVMTGQGNDPSVAIDYTNMLQVAGVPLTATEQAGLAGATQAINAPVPRPFSTTKISGYDFGAKMPAGGWSPKAPGQSYGWQTHEGIDYGTRAGDRIVSPFAGTIHVATGVPGYGNIVYVTLDNGWTMGFGHVANGEVQNGARVNPGDLIAIAGANVGSSVGSVTIVTWQDPTAQWKNGVLQGGYQNPHQALDPIFSGTTYSTLGVPGAAGTGSPTVNKTLDAEYPSIKADWTQLYGTPPSPEDVYNVLQHGSTPAEWRDYMEALPGHIDGMTVGQVYNTRQTADSVSQSVLGHPATDGIVKELYDSGMTSQQQMKLWYDEQAPTDIPKATYNAIYTANRPNTKGVLNEPTGADPRDIKAIYDSAKVKQGGALQ